MAVLEIIKQSNPILRKKSEQIHEIDDEIKQNIIDLKDTLKTTDGVGIAAPQVGILKRIVYVNYENKEYILINPKIVMKDGKIKDYEGCLSVSEEEFKYISAKVERAFLVEVEALNENGEKINILADGMLARIFQHEIEHLDGILYIDKNIEDIQKFKTLEEKKAWKETRKNAKKRKVLIGMSGGVDSSTSAIILKEMGYEVIGATMKLCSNENISEEDAKKVCDKLQIEHIELDCTEQFKKHVIDDFIDCYKNCKTPNPCIECNKYLKFGAFYQKAMQLGCDYVATGHYAKIEYSEEYNQYVMKKSNLDKKDQTYFLYKLPKEILDKILFPLENFTDKSDIRKIAEKHDLNVASKKDSQEICFIPDNNYVEFLKQNSKENIKSGDIILKDGIVVGKHNGLINYTIGQRKGLGISYEKPLYVIKLDKEKNQVIVGEEKDLYKKELQAIECNFVLNIDLTKEIEVMAKVRYRAKEAKAILSYKDNIASVVFEEEQRAITPGQSVVFYIGDIVLGGGKII